jgi:GntR family transcriptional regulator/MocR family aminotransferase
MPKRAAGTTPIALQVDRTARESLDMQIAGQLRQLILLGTLSPGARLPSTRALSRDLGVARNVVIAACAQLVAEGYLEARTGSGTRVAITRPEGMLRAPAPRALSARQGH